MNESQFKFKSSTCIYLQWDCDWFLNTGVYFDPRVLKDWCYKWPITIALLELNCHLDDKAMVNIMFRPGYIWIIWIRMYRIQKCWHSKWLTDIQYGQHLMASWRLRCVPASFLDGNYSFSHVFSKQRCSFSFLNYGPHTSRPTQLTTITAFCFAPVDSGFWRVQVLNTAHPAGARPMRSRCPFANIQYSFACKHAKHPGIMSKNI